MKKTFWIIYAVCLVVVMVIGYFMISGKNTEIEAINADMASRDAAIKGIRKQIKDKELPNKTWPGFFEERLDEFKGNEEALKERLNGYNGKLEAKLPVGIQRFHGAFIANWLPVLKSLLDNGFQIRSAAVLPATFAMQFESGALARELGVPLAWVQGESVQDPTEEQRAVAEEQMWLQQRVIRHFMQAEMKNGNWKEYSYLRQDETVSDLPSGRIPGMGARMPVMRGDSGQQKIDPPTVRSILFKLPSVSSSGGGYGGYGGEQGFGGPGGGGGAAGVQYKKEQSFYDEYHFEADFRIRYTSIDGFLNALIRDPQFFFVIDKVKIGAMPAPAGPDHKVHYKFKDPIKPENEPPVDLVITGRVLKFDFQRMTAPPKKKSGRPKKKR